MIYLPEKLHIDIETYSSEDLKKCGVHKYAASPDFEIMLLTLGYLDEQRARVYEQYEPTNGVLIPPSRLAWLTNPRVVKYAFNAMFERVCLSAFLGEQLDPAQWRCVMVKCGFAGLPLSLDKVSQVLDLENVKLAGAHLINYFAKPCKPTKANGGRLRNLPEHNPEKWGEYKDYNLADVAAEWDVDEFLNSAGLEVPPLEWEYYAVDQRINDRGVGIDVRMAANGVRMADEVKTDLLEEIKSITGVENGRSVSQLVAWLNANGCETDNLRAETLSGLLGLLPDGDTRRVIELREQASRTSTDKYKAAIHCAEADGRARGLFAFNGAYRTGRFAGRRVQMQNLSRIKFTDDNKVLDFARGIVCAGDTATLELMYAAPIELLSELIRTVFVAADGHVLVAADYSAIEARVLAWLAGEEWKLDVFRTHGKIYEATAARMFTVPFESIGKGSDLRQKGKVGELAFGYEGAVGAVDKMGFLKDGTLTTQEVLRMVKRWRQENPNIVKMWRGVEKAAINAVRCKHRYFESNKCDFYCNGTWLFIELPSGRELAYYKPVIVYGERGDSLYYEGENDRKQWSRVNTYGGKLTENITQAVSRDILCEAMHRLDRRGYNIVLHVHDEIGVEMPDTNPELELEKISKLLSINPAWADGLPLRADGFVSKYYKK